MLRRLKKLYLRIGIHTAPPGTILYYIHRPVYLLHERASRIWPALVKAVAVSAGPSFPAGRPNPAAVPHWYQIVLPRARHPAPAGASPLHFREMLRLGEHVLFDLDWAIHHAGARGIAFICFFGMGDYLFATPFFAAVKRRYPRTPIHAYVSNVMDSNNSPLVGTLMEHDRNIDKIFYYNGDRDWRFDLNFRNYNYDDAFNLVPRDFLAVPMMYEYAGHVSHRVYTLFDSFRLPRPDRLVRPILPLPDVPSEKTLALVAEIERRFETKKYSRIVFLHLDMRSSRYSYPYAQELAEGLEDMGCLVVSFSPIKPSEACLPIDIKNLSITESIHILKMIHNRHGDGVSMITASSVFWSVSAGLNIKNLGIHHFYEECIHNVWYDNITIVTRYRYPGIPAERIFVAGDADFSINKDGFDDISLAFLMTCVRAHLIDNRLERAA